MLGFLNDVGNGSVFVKHGHAKRFWMFFLTGDQETAWRFISFREGLDVFPKFNRGDVVGKIHHQPCIFIVGPSQVEGVSNTKRLFFNHIVNAFSRQALPNMACNLVNEAI